MGGEMVVKALPSPPLFALHLRTVWPISVSPLLPLLLFMGHGPASSLQKPSEEDVGGPRVTRGGPGGGSCHPRVASVNVAWKISDDIGERKRKKKERGGHGCCSLGGASPAEQQTLQTRTLAPSSGFTSVTVISQKLRPRLANIVNLFFFWFFSLVRARTPC